MVQWSRMVSISSRSVVKRLLRGKPLVEDEVLLDNTALATTAHCINN